MPHLQHGPKRKLEILSQADGADGVVVTWVLARRGHRLAVESRWVDRLPAFVAALNDAARMAHFHPVPHTAVGRIERLPPTGHVDVIVVPAEPHAPDVLATPSNVRSRTTKAFFPRLLP